MKQVLHPVPYGYLVSIEIERIGDRAYVHVHCPMYEVKKHTMTHCYISKEFTDSQILNDSNFKRTMLKMFGQSDVIGVGHVG